MSSLDEKKASDRRDRRSPPRRNRSPNVKGGTRCPECDFTTSSMDSLNEHIRGTGHKQRDDGRTRDKGQRSRTERRRRSDSRERRRRSDSRERRRRSDSRERRRRRRSSSRERRRRRSGSREKDIPNKEKKTDPTPNRVPDKEKKTDPTPNSVPDKQKKPDPPPSGVPGMVPDHIRRSIYVLQDYIKRTEREPLIGLEYILEYKVQVRYDRMDTKYFCEICEMDSGVVPMVDHLCGFKHRKLYVAKEYPYVLKALFSTKDDRAVFMRRMAMEIEQEEGTKMYKTDPLIRMVPVMNVKSTEAKQSKRSTRWDPEGDRQRKMEQALDFLDSYEIDTEDDVATVTNLLEKMSAELKTHTDKLREEALFPAKVARAKGVAVSIMRNAVIAWMYQRHVARIERLREKRNMSRPGAPFQPNNAGIPQWPFFPLNQIHNLQMPGIAWKNQPVNLQLDPHDEDIQFLKSLMELLDVLPDGLTDDDDLQMDTEFLQLLKAALLDKTENLEDMPADQLMQFASLAQDLVGMDNAPQNIMALKNPAAMGDLSSNALMQMASMANIALPVANAQATPNPLLQIGAPLQNLQMGAPLQNLQLGAPLQNLQLGAPLQNLQLGAPLQNQQLGATLQNLQLGATLQNLQLGAPLQNLQLGAPLQNLQLGAPLQNQQLGAPLQNQQLGAPLQNQQLGAPLQNQQLGAPLQNQQLGVPLQNQQLGAPLQKQPMGAPLQKQPMNVNSLLPENRNSLLPENRNIQQRDLVPTGNSLGMPIGQTTNRRPYMEGQPGHASTSKIVDDFDFEGRLAEKFGNNNRSRFEDTAKPMGYMLNEPTREKSSGMSGRKWDEPPYRNTPKTGVLSKQRLEQERFLDGYNCDLIRDIQAQETTPNFGGRNLTSIDEPSWVERDTDMRYAKRARLDGDVMSAQSSEWERRYPDESDSQGTITPKLSADLLKRIRGKDLFTVSAILSEVAESHSST